MFDVPRQLETVHPTEIQRPVIVPPISDPHANFASLTPRERRAMALIVAGEPTKIVALELNVSQRTAARVRADVFRKMQVPSAVGLARVAAELSHPTTAAKLTPPPARPQTADWQSELAERERQLVVYDLHDGPAQYIVAALSCLQAYRRFRMEDAAKAEALWERGLDAVQRCNVELRRLMQGLQPPLLQEMGVVSAVEDLVQRYTSEHGIEIEFCSELPATRLPAAMENVVFRIVQEALTNACRHSRSHKSRVRLTQSTEAVTIEIRDWGNGGANLRIDQAHLGLRGIHQRARLLGGQATVRSLPGEGTQVLVEIPFCVRS